MPIYQYRCDNPGCDNAPEEIRTMAERNDCNSCPECGVGKLMPQVSTIARTPSKWGDTPNFGT